MNIKTEYDIGDEVYFVEKEKVKRAKIERIYVSIDETGVTVEFRYLKTISFGSIYTTITNPKRTMEELCEPSVNTQ